MERLLDVCNLKLGKDIILQDKVTSDELMFRWASGGMLAIGETFMWGMWKPEPSLEVVLYKMMSAKREEIRAAFKPYSKERLYMAVMRMVGWLQDYTMNSLSMRKHCGDIHYDLPAELFDAILGKHRAYSCGLWDNTMSLDNAEENKLKYIAESLGLHKMSAEKRKEFTLLDIGCGWGSLANYLVDRYGIQVTGLTNAAATATRVDDRVNVIVGDMFEVDFGVNKYDAVTMIEIEHVGKDNYVQLFERISKSLKPGGIYFMESILVRRTAPAKVNEEFCNKYLFPGGYFPSMALLTQAAEDSRMKLLYCHDLGEKNFLLTLEQWCRNLEAQIGKGMVPDETLRAFQMAYTILHANISTDRVSMAMIMFAPRGGRTGCSIRPAMPPLPPTANESAQ